MTLIKKVLIRKLEILPSVFEESSDCRIDVNLRPQTYCLAIANGGEKEFNFAWERFKKSQVASEKKIILSALACTKEVWLLNRCYFIDVYFKSILFLILHLRYLKMSISEGSGVRKGDGFSVIGDIASNTIGRCLTFDFINDQWERVHEL